MEITPGKYRHFKGNEYEVLYIARHSETLEEMVVYRALYGERGIWVRPASMWNEIVERDGKTYRRFTKIEEHKTGRRFAVPFYSTFFLKRSPRSGGRRPWSAHARRESTAPSDRRGSGHSVSASRSAGDCRSARGVPPRTPKTAAS